MTIHPLVQSMNAKWDNLSSIEEKKKFRMAAHPIVHYLLHEDLSDEDMADFLRSEYSSPFTGEMPEVYGISVEDVVQLIRLFMNAMAKRGVA